MAFVGQSRDHISSIQPAGEIQQFAAFAAEGTPRVVRAENGVLVAVGAGGTHGLRIASRQSGVKDGVLGSRETEGRVRGRGQGEIVSVLKSANFCPQFGRDGVMRRA